MGHTDVTAEEVAEFRRMHAEGMSFYRIAKETGRNHQTVSHWVKGPYRGSKTGQRVKPLSLSGDGDRMCASCGEHPARYSPDEDCYRRCSECQSSYYSQYYFRKKYGLTMDEIVDKVEQQGGRCAICGVVPDYPLHVDHSHTTGQVRGLLCAGCNTALGKFGDSIDGLMRAVAYLMEYGEESDEV